VSESGINVILIDGLRDVDAVDDLAAVREASPLDSRFTQATLNSGL
jgi:glycosyltransferase A (GT-A) superfamily protein (DUF2064 family)